MAEVKSTTIVPIAFYCFCLGLYFLSLAANTVFGKGVNLETADMLFWSPVIACCIFGLGMFYVGGGILNVQLLCWKILFFCLTICVSSIASTILALIILIIIGAGFIFPYLQALQISSPWWFSFLAVFLSQIIVLYYLTSGEVVASFGDMGDLISPF